MFLFFLLRVVAAHVVFAIFLLVRLRLFLFAVLIIVRQKVCFLGQEVIFLGL